MGKKVFREGRGKWRRYYFIRQLPAQHFFGLVVAVNKLFVLAVVVVQVVQFQVELYVNVAHHHAPCLVMILTIQSDDL